MGSVVVDDAMDLDRFWRVGYALTQLHPQFARSLAARVQRESYVRNSQDARDPGAASWEDGASGLPHNNAVPRVYSDFFARLQDEPYFEAHQGRFGAFSRHITMLQLAGCGDQMGWHWDGCDATHLVNMVYLTPHRWDDGDGGALEIGRCGVDVSGQPSMDTGVEVTGSVMPCNGTVVTLNNLSPAFVHRVTRVVGDKHRYTLIGQFGYQENIDPERTSQWAGTGRW